MNEIESEVQSFIIRIWVEEYAEKGRRGIWRGQITHVPDGERRYLKDLDEIGDFISPYLESMGVKLGCIGALDSGSDARLDKIEH